ncbi:N-acetyltransferase family protein [Marivivens sp. LCG002]|uniref:GNAT family N-acetyltransferase n=1 Tax=Marivivens sp. LCG002 TaxID=3051171 RepID=UPI0025552AA9|nr:GNAT family N-acetyltransferase [Marivivens sp. LCG002]WIV51895.1 N-acetyltransferase family protein [Marivivens sp. LCG002]
MIIRDALAKDAGPVAGIYNQAVRETVAIWNDTEVDVANRRAWIADRQVAGYPVLVLEDEGEVVGYASYGPFRPFDGYKYSVEHSVYLRTDYHGRGLGRLLMEKLIERARKGKVHVMIGGIAAENEGSIALHRKLGFEETGRLPQVGQKFGRWLDLVFMQLRVDERQEP